MGECKPLASGPENVLSIVLCKVGFMDTSIFCGGAVVAKCDRHYVKDQAGFRV